jgi:hypothetical protein
LRQDVRKTYIKESKSDIEGSVHKSVSYVKI